MWLTWFWWRQCLLIAVASVSIHLNALLVKTDYPKCSSWRAKKCLLVLPMWTLLQVFHVNLYSSIELRHLGIWSLNRKALNILTVTLTLSWRRPLSYRNQSIDLSKSMDWFLYDRNLRHEEPPSPLQCFWKLKGVPHVRKKQGLKRRFFNLKQKKEIIRKLINASQLVTRNFNNITEKLE